MDLRILSLLFISFIFACSPSTSKQESQSTKMIEEAKVEYDQAPSKETAAKYIATITAFSQENKEHPNNDQYVQSGIDIAKKEGLEITAAGLMSSYLKQHPKSSIAKEMSIDLITTMEKMGKTNAAKSLMAGFTYRFPNDPQTKAYADKIGQLPPPDEYMKQKGEQIFDTENPNQLSKTGAFDYVDATEAFVMMNPDYQESPKFLTKAAEVAKVTGTYNKALSIYDWILMQYPDSKEAPMAQFLKALVLEDNLKNIPEARKNYEAFIANYPDHSFVDDAKFSLENLGKTNEEIQQYLEQKRKEQEAANAEEPS